MLITDFQFELPEHLIAQEPLADRENSRLLAVDRSLRSFEDKGFSDLPGFLKKGDVLVLNNTKVFPARLFGTSETGAKVEIFLIEEIENRLWLTLARPAKRLRTGKKILFSERLTGQILDKMPDGKVAVKFEADGEFDEIVQEIGKTPLPPYIKRVDTEIDADRERYQTVYATKRGAIAAPTAGLHFTPQTLRNIREIGVETLEITLHVGYGTFEPVRVEELSGHSVMPERFEIDEQTAAALNRAIADGRRIVAVGTTTTRALESSFAKNGGRFIAESGLADLTILPGYRFDVVNALLTNFHLPESSLLILVSTFGGHELIMKAYEHAVAAQYRFYSYGDCMLIV